MPAKQVTRNPEAYKTRGRTVTTGESSRKEENQQHSLSPEPTQQMNHPTKSRDTNLRSNLQARRLIERQSNRAMQEPGTERQGGRAKGNCRQEPAEDDQRYRKAQQKTPRRRLSQSGLKGSLEKGRQATHQGTGTQNSRCITAHPRTIQGCREPEGGSKATRPQVPKSQKHGTKKTLRGGKERPTPIQEGLGTSPDPNARHREPRNCKNSPDIGTHAEGRPVKEK